MGKKSRDAIRIVSLITCRALSSPTIAGPAGAAYGSIFSAGFSSFSSVGVSSNVSASVVVAGEGGVSAASSRGKARKDEEDVVRGRLELDHVVALMRSRGSRFPRGRRPGAADAARADADARGARDARIAILATRARPAHETRSILGGARENDERARANIHLDEFAKRAIDFGTSSRVRMIFAARTKYLLSSRRRYHMRATPSSAG
jgi:hypothetical protein